MERLAISDGLTGMYNYRHFRETLANEVSRAERYDETFCLLMMDLDHFKAVNDTIGHQQGDEVLQRWPTSCADARASRTIMARYGGEEFVMILPHTASARRARSPSASARRSPRSTPAIRRCR